MDGCPFNFLLLSWAVRSFLEFNINSRGRSLQCGTRLCKGALSVSTTARFSPSDPVDRLSASSALVAPVPQFVKRIYAVGRGSHKIVR